MEVTNRTIINIKEDFVIIEGLQFQHLKTVNDIAIHLGLSYSLFWIICTFVVITITLFFVWKQAIIENNKSNNGLNQQEKSKREIYQLGDKSIYIENNNGDINNN